MPGRETLRVRSYPGWVTDVPDEPTTGAGDDAVDDEDVVDTNVDRFIDRMVQGSGGTIAGNAMIGLAKGMGLHKKVEIAAEIREIGPPEPDDDDPIEVTIDPDHPEKTRIVYRLHRSDGSDRDTRSR